jgi:YfiH family protein
MNKACSKLDAAALGRGPSCLMSLVPGTQVEVMVTTRHAGDASGARLQGMLGSLSAIEGCGHLAVQETFALTQVHGASVVVLSREGTQLPKDFPQADALVARGKGKAIAVRTADCAPVVMACPDGVFAVVHAGWRGLLQGVIPACTKALREQGVSPEELRAVVGPCIGPECYEFTEADLSPLVDHFGSSVRSTTSSGRPALNLREAVKASLKRSGVELVGCLGGCTACETDEDGGPLWFSYRARREDQRMATLALVRQGP